VNAAITKLKRDSFQIVENSDFIIRGIPLTRMVISK